MIACEVVPVLPDDTVGDLEIDPKDLQRSWHDWCGTINMWYTMVDPNILMVKIMGTISWAPCFQSSPCCFGARWETFRSGGKGGQNVNKLETGPVGPLCQNMPKWVCPCLSENPSFEFQWGKMNWHSIILNQPLNWHVFRQTRQPRPLKLQVAGSG